MQRPSAVGLAARATEQLLCCPADAPLHSAPAAPFSEGLDPAFSDSSVEDFTLAIIGDLHLERRGADKFDAARRQLREVLMRAPCARIVQLGDLGGYNDQPGALIALVMDAGPRHEHAQRSACLAHAQSGWERACRPVRC